MISIADLTKHGSPVKNIEHRNLSGFLGLSDQEGVVDNGRPNCSQISKYIIQRVACDNSVSSRNCGHEGVIVSIMWYNVAKNKICVSVE